MKQLSKNLIIFRIIFITFIFSSNGFAENLYITIPAKEYQLKTIKGYAAVMMTDFGATTTPGEPKLPAKTFMIALPPGAEVNNVTVTGNNSVFIDGNYKIQPVRLTSHKELSEIKNYVNDLKQARLEWQKNYDSIYAFDTAYPQKIGEYLGQGQWRKYTYARVRFYPIQYYPKSGQLLSYQSCTVSIDYNMPAPGNPKWQQMQNLLSDNVLDDIISENLINYNDAQKWYKPKNPKILTTMNNNSKYDYVILVKDENMRQTVNPLKIWKEKLGHRVKVVRLDSIYVTCRGYDIAEKIWYFLHENYSIEQWGIRYVLLIGDVDDLPIRFLFPSEKEWAYASDFYYAKLFQAWTDIGDRDNFWGEFSDDGFDPTPDVLVGRIPHNDPKTVANICTNIINFEQDIGSWKQNMLMAMGVIDYDGYKTDCAELGEYLKKNILDINLWKYTTLYEKDGLDTSMYKCNLPLSEPNFTASCGPNRHGIINASAHGSAGGMISFVWRRDANKNGRWDPKEDNVSNEFSLLYNITANFTSAVVFLCGCNTGLPCDIESKSINSSWLLHRIPHDNIAKRYIGNGAVAVIAATAGGDYCADWSDPSDSGSESLDYYFCHQLIVKDKRVGDAYYDAMLQYVNNHTLQRGIRVFGYLGDPSLNLRGIQDRPGGTDVAIHKGYHAHFAADNSNGGDMYVAVITTHYLQMGEVKIYKSSDYGATWSLWNTISHRSGFNDVKVIVGEYTELADNCLLVFLTSSNGTVQVYRFPLAGGTSETVIIASEGGINSLLELSVTRDPRSYAYFLYLTYSIYNPNSETYKIKVCRSADNGVSWQNLYEDDGVYSPDIDVDANRKVYLVARKDNSTRDIYVKTSEDAGINWNSWLNISPNDGAYSHGWSAPRVAASTDPAYPTVWVIYSYYKVGDPNKGDIRYAYTTGGENSHHWFQNLSLVEEAAFEGAFDIKGYKAGANRWVNLAYIYNPGNPQVAWRYASGSCPDLWSFTRMVNDFEAEQFYDAPPRIVYSPGAPGSGSGVVYSSPNAIYFSAPWLKNQSIAYQNDRIKDVTCSISSNNGKASIKLQIPEDTQVTVMIHDAVGKLVRIITKEKMAAGNHEIHWDGLTNAGDPVTSGRYLCTIKTSSGTVSKELVIKSEQRKTCLQKSASSDWIKTGELNRAFIVSSLLTVNDNTIYAAAITSVDVTRNEGVVFRSIDEGQSWQKLGVLEGCWSAIHIYQSSQNHLFVGGMMFENDRDWGVIYRSDNDGASWTTVHLFPDGAVYDIIETTDGILYSATGWSGFVFKSEDGGSQWTQVTSLGENGHIYSMFQASNNELYAALELPDNTGQIVRSQGNDMTWILSTGLEGVSAVYDVIETQGKLYAGVRGADAGWIYQSELNSNIWTATSELPDTNIKAVHSLQADEETGIILAGTEMIPGPSFTKIFISKTQGGNWKQFGMAIDLANIVYSLAKTSNIIYAGTGYVYGNVYKYITDSTSIVNKLNDIIPNSYMLEQNYPNPFNPTTTIKFALPENSYVTLKLFDVLGRNIATLVDDEFQPGEYKVVFDAKNLPSGVYVYSLQAGSFIKQKKLLLIR